jgi:hypothetical protein
MIRRREFLRSLTLGPISSGMCRPRTLMASLVTASTDLGHASPPVVIDVGRQLFVDDFLIGESTLERRFHKPYVHSSSPVIRPETAIELNHGVMPAAAPFGDGVWFDAKDQLYKMWYIAGYDDGFGYAISRDGLHWERPTLDVVAGTNRTLAQIPGYVRNGSTVWLDHDAQDPSQRFKMFAYFRMGNGQWPRMSVPSPRPPDYSVGHAYTSPDGVHWSKPIRTGDCGDNTGMFYNPFRKMWVYSIRTQDKRHGRTRSYRECPDFLLGAPWQAEDVKPWLACDERDSPDPVLGYRPELYKVDCTPYESLMLGLFAIYYGPPNEVAEKGGYPKTNDLELGFSRDGLTWERPNRTAFLACSRTPGTWNRGYLHASGGLCLIVGDEVHFYFTGFSGISPKLGGCLYAGASVGLAILRRDGFASLSGPGSVTTETVTFHGKYLFVNVNGVLRCEVLDRNGAVIRQLSEAECVPIETNRTKQLISWKEVAHLGQLAGHPVKFRFILEKGDLYSFWVSSEHSGASHGYVAAGGPGFTGSRDSTGA